MEIFRRTKENIQQFSEQQRKSNCLDITKLNKKPNAQQQFGKMAGLLQSIHFFD